MGRLDFDEVALGRTTCAYQTALTDAVCYNRPTSPYTVSQDVIWVAAGSTPDLLRRAHRVQRDRAGLQAGQRSRSPGRTWAGWPRSALQTLLTPPVGAYDPTNGHVAVQLFDRDAVPLAGQIGQPGRARAGATQVTTEDGCAFFAYLDPGTYTATSATTGYVDRQGEQPALATSVVGGQVTKVHRHLRPGGHPDGRPWSPPAGAVVPDGIAVTVANTDLATPTSSTFAGSGSPRTVGPLFPYAGRLPGLGRRLRRRRPGQPWRGRGPILTSRPGRRAARAAPPWTPST